MKKTGVLKGMAKGVVMAAAIAIAAGAAAGAAAEKLSFVVMGDSRPVVGTLPQSPPFERMLWETDLIGPDMNMHVGDLVFGYGSGAFELKRQYEDLAKTLKKARTPIHFAIGNHELGSDGGNDLYQGTIGKVYYSFDKGSSHFISLHSDWGGGSDTGTLGQEQFEWLKKDLAAAKGAKNIFVFMHKPMFDSQNDGGSSWEDIAMRDAVHKMFLEAGNVRIVFAGHIHDYRHIVKDGIPYYVTGGGGAETGYPERGGFYHYLYVQVKGTSADVRVVEPYHLWTYCEPECDGKNSKVKVSVVNSLGSNMPIILRGVEVKMPKLPKGMKYKPAGAILLNTQDNGDSTVTLRFKAIMNSPVGYKFFNLSPAPADK